MQKMIIPTTCESYHSQNILKKERERDVKNAPYHEALSDTQC